MRAILFDVYGTLIDIDRIGEAVEALFAGYGGTLSRLWRIKQIDYTRVRTLGGRHADFEAVTGDALDYAAEKLGLRLAPADRTGLLAAYRGLPAYADVAPALGTLRARGVRLGVLSNGTPGMVAASLGAAGLGEAFDPVLSIEAAGKYKTAPEAYALGTAALGLGAAEVGFVSANGWDIAGASWFGYRTFWVNRTGEPLERLGVTPDGRGRTLGELVAWAGG